MFLLQACFSSRLFAKLNLNHTGVAAPCMLLAPSVDTELVLITCVRHRSMSLMHTALNSICVIHKFVIQKQDFVIPTLSLE